jgi:MFS family permease
MGSGNDVIRPAGVTIARVSGRWCGLFAVAWTGIWMAQLTPFQLLLPQQLNDSMGLELFVDESSWQRSVVDFGVISGLSALCAVIAYPVAGALSDRTTSRFGRRRPWILGGTVLFALSLAILGLQHTSVGIAVWWCLAMFGFCAASAALTAMIKDRVPHEQRGVVAGWISVAQAAGLILGLGLVAALALTPPVSYPLIAVLLVVCVLPFVVGTPDRPIALDDTARTPGSILRLLAFHDFRWALTGRVVVNLGSSLATCLMVYYLQFELEVEDADDALLVLTACYIVSVIAVSIVSGWLSDRFGRRKPFILVSALLQTAAAVLFIFSGNIWEATVAGILMGAGYGCFMSIDQALAADILPDAAHSGQELGIMNIALAVPQAMSPLMAAGIVEMSSGGFTALFVTAALLTTIGGFTVLRIESTR